MIDWFCGLGNFTLPLATPGARRCWASRAATALVERARDNAARNGLADAHAFEARNLFELTAADLQALGPADALAGRPAARRRLRAGQGHCRSGADAAPPGEPPRRIVYVSCNPATLARDAGLLVHQAGYRCTLAGVVNMFPHTAHVESMAVFDRT